MNLLRPALTLFVALSLLTGVVYPLAVTGVAQVIFPRQANGSLIERNGKVVGSELLGQEFSEPRYFWGRLSATGPFPYNGGASSGSNLGPLNPTLHKNAEARVVALKQADPENQQPIPLDLITASGSGLDPEISPAAAEYQVARVARERGLSEARIRELVAMNTQQRTLGLLGEPRVNVLKLNLALDQMK